MYILKHGRFLRSPEGDMGGDGGGNPAPAPALTSEQAPPASLQDAIEQQLAFDAGKPIDKPKAPKPDAKKEAKTKTEDKPVAKSPLEALDKLAPKSAEAKEPAEAVVEPDDSTPSKDQTRWKELKAAESWKKENEPKITELQNKIKELESKWTPETEKEMEENRRFRAARDIESTKEYQDEVETPYQAKIQAIQEVSEFTGIDANSIMEAMREPNRLKRNEAISLLMESSEKTLRPAVIDELFTAGDELQRIGKKAAEFQTKATEIRAQLDNQTASQRAATEAKEKQILTQSIKEVHSTLKTNLADLLGDLKDDKGVVFDAESLANASVAQDPMEVAYNSQAGALVPYFVMAMRQLKAELKNLKAGKQQEAGLNPSPRAATVPVKGKDTLPTLEDAMAAHRAGGHL